MCDRLSAFAAEVSWPRLPSPRYSTPFRGAAIEPLVSGTWPVPPRWPAHLRISFFISLTTSANFGSAARFFSSFGSVAYSNNCTPFSPLPPHSV